MLPFALRTALSLRASCGKVLITIANTASHDVTLTISRILPPTKSFSRGIGSMTFTFTFEEDLCVVARPYKSTGLTLSFAFAFTAFGKA